MEAGGSLNLPYGTLSLFPDVIDDADDVTLKGVDMGNYSEPEYFLNWPDGPPEPEKEAQEETTQGST